MMVAARVLCSAVSSAGERVEKMADLMVAWMVAWSVVEMEFCSVGCLVGPMVACLVDAKVACLAV